MSFELHPITDFNAREAGTRINELVKSNEGRRHFASRYLMGVLQRHSGDVESSVAAVENAQRKQANSVQGRYAITHDDGDIIGFATSQPGLPLRRLRRATTANRAPWPLATTKFAYRHYDPNIAAWVVNKDLDLTRIALTVAYGRLALSTGDNFDKYLEYRGVQRDHGTNAYLQAHSSFNPWTIEPVPPFGNESLEAGPMHLAVTSAIMFSLGRRATGRFDDGEPALQVPPRSDLFSLQDGTIGI